MMPRSNIYSASAEEIRELFGDYLDGSDACIALALSERPLDETARSAIAKSLESFGYGDGTCTHATLLPADESVEGGDVPLDGQALFLLVEGLDPLFLICCDATSAACLGQAYRTSLDLDASTRAFGRTVVVFRDFASMLSTEKGKQRAWRLLKSLPKR